MAFIINGLLKLLHEETKCISTWVFWFQNVYFSSNFLVWSMSINYTKSSIPFKFISCFSSKSLRCWHYSQPILPSFLWSVAIGRDSIFSFDSCLKKHPLFFFSSLLFFYSFLPFHSIGNLFLFYFCILFALKIHCLVV